MKKVYKYVLSEDFTYCSELLNGIIFVGKWGKIENGTLTIYKNYAWDGCSPKCKIFGKYIIGTPDGWFKGFRYIKNWTRKASLVHDFLYQFSDYIFGLTRQIADYIFFMMLVELKFSLKYTYYTAVRIFGKKYWKA